MAFSVHALFYGDYPDLAKRCLSSIEAALKPVPPGVIQDFRLGLNEVTESVLHYVTEWSQRVADRYDIPSTLFHCPKNVCKYPLMRKMFHHRRPAEWVMWFDDDSYLRGTDPNFFNTWHRTCSSFDEHTVMVGENDWERKLQGNQPKYFASKPWFTGVTWGGRRGSTWTPFCTGGWWILHRKIIKKYDWPDMDIHHVGGDQMLGVLLRQQGWKTKSSDTSTVAVNADEKGNRSKAKRRGIRKEPLVGANWRPGIPISHTFHNFTPIITEITRSSDGESTTPPGDRPRPEAF